MAKNENWKNYITWNLAQLLNGLRRGIGIGGLGVQTPQSNEPDWMTCRILSDRKLKKFNVVIILDESGCLLENRPRLDKSSFAKMCNINASCAIDLPPKGNVQFVQKVTFQPLMDFKQNHHRIWKYYKKLLLLIVFFT